MMRVLVIGSGGREHALAWRLAQSASVTHVISAPGSDALRGVGRCFDVDVTDHGAVGALCDQQGVGLVVIGPEAPLVDGLADSLRALGLPVVGPGAAAAQLEGSKAYAKALMDRCGIPTAAFSVHESLEEALQALSDGEGPIVVKADGLAAGKGVTVAPDRATAELAVRECFEGR
ncbi:MAG: phosphoribosylamine--glycine ligase, partial [Myxococcota bacterium]|nr:phosphoribosylamine--glycine ligase [Myxococcota bacterium]